MLEEVAHLLKTIEITARSGSVNIHQLLAPSIANNMCFLTFGRRYDYDDPDQGEMNEAVQMFVRNLQLGGGLQLILPALGTFFYNYGIGPYGNIKKALSTMDRIVAKRIAERRKVFSYNDPNDLLDAYLLEQQNRKGQKEHSFTGNDHKSPDCRR